MSGFIEHGNNMKLYHRKHPRLKDFDYNQNGCYFVTMCTQDKRCFLSDIVGRGFLDAPQIGLTEYGSCIDSAIAFLNEKSDKLSIDKYIIMPNHVHILVVIENAEDGGASGKPRPTDAMIPKFVSSLKRYTNRACKTELWQTGSYDHIIRDEADYMIKWQYIDNNPAKWIEDEYYSE